ncbi:DedA family protein [Micromonospora mirobrigensis]|uniref:Membrane protein DedA, SNARE-associated domain n=1 Tax=Micromonospora mirobrigensis TaxID=262898 RepID=A0A1C4WM99_9ACTN|nr:DedA family protein [Micromonospora mirobrigensis]SCE97304.1 membrane protein DedA, SNARE-associated domain [Micromonospora mirobrigensis]
MDRLWEALLGLPPALVLLLAFLLPALEASTFLGLLVPGEIAVLLGGVYAHDGRLPLVAVVLAALAGAVLGDQVGYLVGRRYGRRLLDRTPRRFVRSDELARALDLVRRRGAAAVVVGRWAAALRALVPGLAGLSGIPRRAFTLANLAGGALWAVAVSGLGYLAGASYRLVERRLGLGGEALLALVVVVVLVRFWRHRRSARHRG